MCCLSRADAGRVDKMSERVSAVNACTSCIIYKRLHEKTAEAQFTRVNKQIKCKCTKLLCKHHTHTHMMCGWEKETSRSALSVEFDRLANDKKCIYVHHCEIVGIL